MMLFVLDRCGLKIAIHSYRIVTISRSHISRYKRDNETISDDHLGLPGDPLHPGICSDGASSSRGAGAPNHVGGGCWFYSFCQTEKEITEIGKPGPSCFLVSDGPTREAFLMERKFCMTNINYLSASS